MPTSDHHAHREPFDDCFEAKPAIPARDLADRVIKGIQSEATRQSDDALDAWIEASLAAWPATPSAEFTERTLTSIQAKARESKTNTWRVAFPLAAGLAACVALVWDLPESGGRVSFPESPAMPAQDIAAIDPVAAEILALAESLDQPARWLLDDTHLTTLVAAVE